MAPNLFGNSLLVTAEGTIAVDGNNKAEHQTVTHKDSSQSQSAGDVVQDDSEMSAIQKATTELRKTQTKYPMKFVWRNIIVFMYLHLGSIYGFYLLFTGRSKPTTFLCGFILGTSAAFGITAGAHRLWAHKSYKARLPLRIFLMILQTIAFQNSIYEWARDHRVHHKFTDTDADPHNASRGFFFSHMGWLLIRKHPEVKAKGKMIDMSDLEQDPVVMFQKKYFIFMMPLLSFLLPAIIPWYLVGDTFSNCWYVASVTRYMISVHLTWLVNSAAHIWGMKPYDKNIRPTNNLTVAILAMGEGWHNYHHVFPWDYRTSEYSSYRTNLSSAFIDLCSKIGQAYDMKTVSEEIVNKRILRTGDGPRNEKDLTEREREIRRLLIEGHDADQGNNNYKDKQMIWGWDDEELTAVDKSFVKILNKEKQK